MFLAHRLLTGFILIICIVELARSEKKSFKNNQQRLAHQRTDEIQGSGQPPKQGSVDDEVGRSSGNNQNPDDEDSTPVVEGSGQPPPHNIVKPTITSTNRPSTTTTTEPNELNIEDQEEDEDMDDEEDEEEDFGSPSSNLKPSDPEITSTTSATPAPKHIFELTTRRPPPPVDDPPTFPSQIEAVNLDMLRPGLLAAISGGAVIGLLLTILLVMFVVYRMRKKDEGSYSLDEQGQHQPPHYSYAYQKAPTKEFYA